jgi:hypothetical protein
MITTAVETGTFEAKTSRVLNELFPTVHTIELQPERWAQCVDLYAKIGIQFHLGDSLAILPAIARAYHSRPCLWFLDAHWFDLAGHGDDWPIPVAGESPFPLWGELKTIVARGQADIVIVDDVHAFGRQDNGWHSVSLQTLDIAIGNRLEHSKIEADFYVAWLRGKS